MNKCQIQFLTVAQGYNQQIGLLMEIAVKSDRKRIKQLTPILNKLKSSFQKLVNQQDQFKQCVFKPEKCKALLQSHIDLLKETKVEIEKVGEKV